MAQEYSIYISVDTTGAVSEINAFGNTITATTEKSKKSFQLG